MQLPTLATAMVPTTDRRVTLKDMLTLSKGEQKEDNLKNVPF
jgi:hypothetical protein